MLLYDYMLLERGGSQIGSFPRVQGENNKSLKPPPRHDQFLFPRFFFCSDEFIRIFHQDGGPCGFTFYVFPLV